MVIITGSGQGLGKAFAAGLLDQGAKVNLFFSDVITNSSCFYWWYVVCRRGGGGLSSLLHLPPVTTAPTCQLLTNIGSLLRACLSYPYDWRGFVGAKNIWHVERLCFLSASRCPFLISRRQTGIYSCFLLVGRCACLISRGDRQAPIHAFYLLAGMHV